MAFVLISSSRGDELMASKDTVVAESQERAALEVLRDERAKKRAEWLAENELPPWIEYSIIQNERIEEVPSIVAK